MKMKFLPVIAITVAAAGVAYVARETVIKNGGVKPTVEKARGGAMGAISKAKKSSAVSALMNAFTTLRERIVGNDNEPSIADRQVEEARG